MDTLFGFRTNMSKSVLFYQSAPTALERLLKVFHSVFEHPWSTRLEGGGIEPLYRPATKQGEYARITFTQDYFSSALHEVAHWCVAGEERRKLPDYGYWYAPDGRDAQQQANFEKSEAAPQAIEWIFSMAAGHRFRVSVDNLLSNACASEGFKTAIWRETQSMCQNGFSNRVKLFAQALHQEFAGNNPFEKNNYRRDAL